MWSTRIALFVAALALGYLVAGPDFTSPTSEQPATSDQQTPDEAAEPTDAAQARKGDKHRGHGHSHGKEGRLQSPHGATSPQTEAELAVKKAERLAKHEPLDPDEVREMLQEQLGEKMPERELTDKEYQRLAEVVMKVRASQRMLKGLEDTGADEEVREKHRRKLTEALAEMFSITGSSPGDMTGGAEPPPPDHGPD